MTETGAARRDPAVAPPRTVHELARQQLAALCDGLELPPERVTMVSSTFDGLAARCGDQRLDRPPRWSGLSDDCTPVEWSVAFRSGPPDVRVLFEAQRDPASVASYWDAGSDLTRWIVEHLGADDALLASVADRFTPRSADLYSTVFHGVELHHDGAIRTKVYVNPALGGDRWEAAADALDRLGLRAQLDAVLNAVGPLDLPLIAFDLEPLHRARVKLYLRSTSFTTLEAVADLCDPPGSADYHPLIAALYRDEPLPRPPFVALHLRATAGADRPARAVLSVPISGPIDTTAVAAERIATLLTSHGLDADAYRRVIDELRRVSNVDTGGTDGYGRHSWVSFQREPDGQPRVTVYFRLRAFADRYGWLGADPVRTWPSPVISEGDLS